MWEENVEVIRRGWDAWLAGDLPALFELFDPEVVWDTSHFRDWPEASYHGREGVQRFLIEWLEIWDKYEVDIEEIVPAPDGRVVTLLLHSGTARSGAPIRLEMAQIATIRNGRVLRFDQYDDQGEALEAAGVARHS